MATPAPDRPRLPDRLNAWLNDPTDPLWERPPPTPQQKRADVVGCAVFLGVALVMLVLTVSVSTDAHEEQSWRQYGSMVLIISPLAARRAYPLTALVVSSGLFLGLAYVSPTTAISLPFQVAYFAVLYAAVAWARHRHMLWIAMGMVLLTMTLWIVITFTTASAYDEMFSADGPPDGPVPAITAAVLYTALVNLAYFGGAIAIGRASWRSALQRERLAEQAVRIREQAGELARRAVVDERLRIARELHDVVAHHVSVIGVQAGAARKVLTRNPDAASEALRTIEGSSRSAVADMRSLLGVLRSETDTERSSGAPRGGQTGPGGGDGPDGTARRSPEPGLRDLTDLATTHRNAGLTVELTVVEEEPGRLDAVPAPVALSLYRVVQESVANVARHSTASSVRVTVRTGTAAAGTRWVEAEIVDDGQPRRGTSGSGYGLRGIRERVQLHDGEAEIGPRAAPSSGWRVRVRMPERAQVPA